jgi:hypothetical protein
MRDLLLSCDWRPVKPIWAVSRGRFTPDRRLIYVPIGNWRAWDREDAIQLAAHAIRGIALLKAERIYP